MGITEAVMSIVRPEKLTMANEKGATLITHGHWDEKMPSERSPLIERVPVAEPQERYPHNGVMRQPEAFDSGL